MDTNNTPHLHAPTHTHNEEEEKGGRDWEEEEECEKQKEKENENEEGEEWGGGVRGVEKEGENRMQYKLKISCQSGGGET